MKAFLVALITLFSAGEWGDTTAKIDKIMMFEGGNLVYIYPVGGLQNKPACHGSHSD